MPFCLGIFGQLIIDYSLPDRANTLKKLIEPLLFAITSMLQLMFFFLRCFIILGKSSLLRHCQ